MSGNAYNSKIEGQKMKLTEEMKMYLSDLVEQLKLDGIALGIAVQCIKEHNQEAAMVIDGVRKSAEEKMYRYKNLISE
jgi:hypothetical protein